MTEDKNNTLKPATSSDIIAVSLEEEMRKSYLDYAMSVIVSRALPDVRDGLKPVHRRILYSMNESNYHHDKPYRKSARIVGDVMGKYHPHGDSAIYDAMVRMAQEFSMRLELIDGQGNFGSMDGDPPAAMRYTEARLAKVSNFLVDDIDKNTVAFKPNYDETVTEPEVLPAKFPNILVNGAGGIAVGMATNIPPHNLGEVIDATISLIENNEITIEELNDYIKGPDFPTGGIIVGKLGIKETYNKGKGSCLVRSKTSIEDYKKDSKVIIVTEIPYQVNKSRLLEKIAECANNKIIDGISDIRDESDRKGLRIVIELKKDFKSDIILNQLYKHTPLQTTFSSNMLALNHKQPQQLNLKEILNAFISFRKEIITKRTIYNLEKTRNKAHLLIGFVVSNLNIDKILEIIKNSKNSSLAKENLMKVKWKISKDIYEIIKIINESQNSNTDKEYYNFSETQAKAILDIRLYKLTSLERDEIKKELIKTNKEIISLLEILNSEKKLLNIIKEELINIKNDFSTKRRTKIIDEENQNFEKINFIQKKDIIITVSNRGYIKSVPLNLYKPQKRGGKGRTGMSMREDDLVTQIFIASTHTKLLVFSSVGKVYLLRAFDILEASPQSRGKSIVNLLPFDKDELISAVVAMPIDEKSWNNLNIVFATSLGMIRKNKLIDVAKSGQRSLRLSGKTAIKLNDKDKLISVNITDDLHDVLLSTTDGKSIRFSISKIRLTSGLNSKGVKGIKLKTNNKVVSMSLLKHSPIDISIRKDYLRYSSNYRKGENIEDNNDFKNLQSNEEFILNITTKGFGKRTSAYEYRIFGNRAGYGLTSILLTKKNGNVVDAFTVENSDEIILMTNGGQIIRVPVNEIRIAGRNTQGVSIFKIPQDEKIVSVSKVSEINEN